MAARAYHWLRCAGQPCIRFPPQTGVAAGLYSMIRSAGIVPGGVLSGVILQFGLERFTLVIDAYRLGFWCVAGAALVGVIIGWGLQE